MKTFLSSSVFRALLLTTTAFIGGLTTVFLAAPNAHLDKEQIVAESTDLQTGEPVQLKINPKSDKGMALFFFSLRCPCARNCLDQVKTKTSELKKLGFKSFIINTDRVTSIEKTKSLFQIIRFELPVLTDSQWNLVKKYNIKTASEMVLLNAKAVPIYSGAIYADEENFLDQVTEDLTLNKPLRLAHGSGMGCALEDPDQPDPFGLN